MTFDFGLKEDDFKYEETSDKILRTLTDVFHLVMVSLQFQISIFNSLK